jgi:hypothetical protein
MRLYRVALALAVVVTAVVVPSSASAAVALFSPERVRVTNVTATQISFAWSQNTTGAVGTIRARVFQDGVLVSTTPLVRYTASGLAPGVTYTFHMVAVDGVGNTSPPTRTFTITTRGPGVTPPGPSDLLATEVSPARVVIAFRQPDDNWDISTYEIFDGPTLVTWIYASSWSGIPTVTLAFREQTPGSAHSYWVRGTRPEFGVSPQSNTLSVTLPARTDTTAPTAPSGLTARGAAYACFSVRLAWTQSSDNNDAQAALDYDVRVNGVREQWVQGAGTASIGIVPVGDNVISVSAVDSSGNSSTVATTIFVRKPSCTDEV